MHLLSTFIVENFMPLIKSVYDLPAWQQIGVVVAVIVSFIAKKSWKNTKSKK